MKRPTPAMIVATTALIASMSGGAFAASHLITGNMIAMRVTHRTTRPNEDDHTPDMSLHDHVFVINASFV